MAASYSAFGLDDRKLYERYLATWEDDAALLPRLGRSSGVRELLREGVRSVLLEGDGLLAASSGGAHMLGHGVGRLGDDVASLSGGDVLGAGRGQSGLCQRCGCDNLSEVEAGGSDGDGGAEGAHDDEVDSSVGGGAGGRAVDARGPNYERNRASRERQKAARKRKAMSSGSWRPVSQATVRPTSPPSLSGTVQTVTTEMAEELEAKRTLASRRAAENRVAEALANHKLQSMLDPDKTKAVANLDAARVEQRINEAKAKAQAAFLKCSDAVTSLGSAGSAGEYVLKKEVKKGQIYQKKYEDAHAQMQEMMKYLSNEAKAKMAQWPAVKVPTYGEMFGDCPAHFNDEQAEAYYRDLANLDEEHVFASEVLF